MLPILALQKLAQELEVETGNNSDTELSFLKEITGADEILSVTITEWKYVWVIGPFIQVTVEYRLIDATTGRTIWQGTVREAPNYQTPPLVGNGERRSTGGPATCLAYLLTRKAIRCTKNELPYGPYYSQLRNKSVFPTLGDSPCR